MPTPPVQESGQSNVLLLLTFVLAVLVLLVTG